ncbi:MAG: DUF4406 domain-containing protein [Verrucomicrobiota bacterium]
MTKKAFISSAYTLGDTCRNVRLQHDVFHILYELGFIPFAPLWSHYHELIYPMSWEEWMKWCKAWIESCDVVLRLPGLSNGADEEVAYAKSLDIVVLSNALQIKSYLESHNIMANNKMRRAVLLGKLIDTLHAYDLALKNE